MKTITKEQLQEVLIKHKLWLEGKGGEKADLRNTDLSFTDLSDADLNSAVLRGANLHNASLKNTILENQLIIQFQFNKHTAYYYGQDEITIGCEKHSISEWLAEYEEIGKKNGYSEEEIKQYGLFIKSCSLYFQESKK